VRLCYRGFALRQVQRCTVGCRLRGWALGPGMDLGPASRPNSLTGHLNPCHGPSHLLGGACIWFGVLLLQVLEGGGVSGCDLDGCSELRVASRSMNTNDASIAFGYQHGVAGSALDGFILTAGGRAVRRVLERVPPRLLVCRWHAQLQGEIASR